MTKSSFALTRVKRLCLKEEKSKKGCNSCYPVDIFVLCLLCCGRNKKNDASHASTVTSSVRMYVCMYVCMYVRQVRWPYRLPCRTVTSHTSPSFKMADVVKLRSVLPRTNSPSGKKNFCQFGKKGQQAGEGRVLLVLYHNMS